MQEVETASTVVPFSPWIFALGTGVVSGIITTALISVSRVLWFKQFVPSYENRIYKGISLKGHWERSSDGPSEDADWSQIETLDIDQTATRLFGTATLTSNDSGSSSSKQLSLIVSGDVSDRFVTLTFRSPIRDRLSYSTLLLEIKGDGNQLMGQACWYNVDNSEIESGTVKYIKR